MKFRLWWRRMSVSSPRMTIKSQLPWPMRAAIFVVGAAVIVGIGSLLYEDGRVPGLSVDGGHEEITHLKEQVQKLTAERDQYSTTANSAETKQNIDRSEQQQLGAQVKSLEDENTKLKEDLAFFESLLPVDANAQGVSIRKLKAETVAPNQLHYQLLVMQGGKGDHDFIGNLQLNVTVVQNGKSAMIAFPEPTTSPAASAPTGPDNFKLAFKHYQRVDGTLTVPDGAVIKSVQARILDKGQIRAQLSSYL
jgi:hypothetical protein